MHASSVGGAEPRDKAQEVLLYRHVLLKLRPTLRDFSEAFKAFAAASSVTLGLANARTRKNTSLTDPIFATL
jgi:hypothetical protein